MRTIKFRAWDGNNHKMIPWEGMQAWRIDAVENKNVMQFTGLKDKNGTEIYEGDIVKGVFYRKGERIIVEMGVVEYSFGAWEIRLPTNWFTPLLREMHSGNNDCVEVIGNIYEHSHLLEEHGKQ